MNSTKITIIGAGSVGTTIAYALMLKSIPAHITLIDLDKKKCHGETLDLSDAAGFCEVNITTEESKDSVSQADIVIIAAGKRQAIGEKRANLLSTNKKVIKNIFDTNSFKKSAIIIMVTNPVDAMTYFAQKYSGLPKNQVFGSGTFLDSQRMRLLLSQKLGIAEQSIHAYVLGEHGDSQFPVWSSATAAGIPL